MDVQKRIKDLMELRGWTDYRLAKEAGLSHSTVTNMFNRSNAPTLPTLEAVCRAFGITLSQFFEDFEDNETLQEQRLLFSKWSTFTPEQRKILLDLMDIIKRSNSQSPHRMESAVFDFIVMSYNVHLVNSTIL